MNKSFKIIVIALLFVGLVVWNYGYKNSVDEYFYSYNKTTAKLKDLKDAILSLNYSIQESVLFQYYNNDTVNKNYQKIELLLGEIESELDQYPQTLNKVKKMNEMLELKQEKIKELMIINAKIKNSMTYLSSQIYKLDQFEREYSHRVMELVNYFFIVKNTLDYSHTTNIELFEQILEYEFKDEEKNLFHDLLKIHTNLLLTEFPYYIEAIKAATSDVQLQMSEETLGVYLEESLKQRQALDWQVLMIVFASVIALAVILYLLLHSEKEKLRIIRLQEEFKKSIKTDMLTKLPNRTAYFSTTKTQDKKFHFVLIDLIEFRNINNIFGMNAGDHLLVEVAKLLQNFSTKCQGCMLYRIGADEFALIYEEQNDAAIAKKANSIIDLLEHSAIFYKDIKIPVSVNIGISNNSPHLLNAQLCIKELHQTFGQKIKFFTPEMNRVDEIKENIDMVQRIKEAIEEDRIVPYFQPIVDAKTKETMRYEALVRIEEGENIISPFFFLDISKKVKLYNTISHRIILMSIQKARQMNIDVAVNISIEDILESKKSNFIYDLIEKNSDIASRITFEIVESEQIKNYEQLLEFIDSVKPYGCKIAIDDFGSGYSNFDHLFNFNVDFLKIDGSLIKKIDSDKNSYMIVKTIVAFAKEAGIATVAEFVHSKEVDSVITELGIDYGQGYHYAQPKKM